jgi:hypothetical protein
MPEAPVHKDDSRVLRKYKIRPAGKLARVKSETESGMVQSGAQQTFRCCIRPADPRHIAASLRRAEAIDHSLCPEVSARHYAQMASVLLLCPAQSCCNSPDYPLFGRVSYSNECFDSFLEVGQRHLFNPILPLWAAVQLF